MALVAPASVPGNGPAGTPVVPGNGPAGTPVVPGNGPAGTPVVPGNGPAGTPVVQTGVPSGRRGTFPYLMDLAPPAICGLRTTFV
jgi:hypothetical protein